MTARKEPLPLFSPLVTEYWLGRAEEQPRSLSTPGRYAIVVDAELPLSRSVMRLDFPDTGGRLSLSPEQARLLGLADTSEIGAPELDAALRQAGIGLNGADHLFYFAIPGQTALREQPEPDSVRQLTAEDADLFADFTAQAPADDLDEAFVELDHWLVFGCFVDGRLAAAASLIPWSGTKFADLGILTLPEFRGRGYGRQTVRAACAHALALGYEPQYRCQPDNAPSNALAAAAGLSLFAAWDVIADDEAE